MSAFNVEAAQYTVDQLKSDRKRAKKLSPSLVPIIDGELEVREAALAEGLKAVKEYDAESAELARAQAIAAAARTAVAFSVETDPTIAEKLIRAAELATHLERVRARRADAARDRAGSQLYKASKDVGARRRAVDFAEKLAGSVLDRNELARPPIPAPDVLAYLRIVLPVEGRAWYEERAKAREGNRSFEAPPAVEAYDDACASTWRRVESERESAREMAAALAAV